MKEFLSLERKREKLLGCRIFELLNFYAVLLQVPIVNNRIETGVNAFSSLLTPFRTALLQIQSASAQCCHSDERYFNKE